MLNLAILLSGSGTTAEAVLSAIVYKQLTGIKPCVVISNQSSAGGIQKVQKYGIPVEIVDRIQYHTDNEFNTTLLEVLQKYKTNLVSQNGWLPLTPPNVVATYRGMIINQHPGPLDPGRPDFGGKHMYGARVVAARIAYCWITKSDYWTESTIHHVNEEFDRGHIIQTKRLIIPEPNEEITLNKLQVNPAFLLQATTTLQQLLLPIEHNNVISVLQSFANNQVPTFGRNKPLILKENYNLLENIKKLVVTLYPKG